MGNRVGAGTRSLADVFLSAPFEADGWDRALKSLARETRSARSQLIAFGGSSTIPINWVTDAQPGLIEEFPTIDGASPDVNWRVASTRSLLEIVWEDHYDQARRDLNSDVYDEFSERYEMPFGCQTVLLDTPGLFYGLAILRTKEDGRTTVDDRRAFAWAAKHVQTAVRLQQAVELQGATMLAGAFEALGGAVFVCDAKGHVRALTSAAEAVLREHLGLQLSSGRLIATRADDDQALQQALRHVLDETNPAPAAREFWLRAPLADFCPVRCEVLPLPRKDWSLTFEPRALVSLHRPANVDERRREQLKAVLGLTQAEAEIAALAADGHSREEIAQIRGASIHTVGSQLKSIFLKTDVTREAQLVALLNKLLR